MSRAAFAALVALGALLVPTAAAADDGSVAQTGVPPLTPEEQQQFADEVWEANADFLFEEDETSKIAAVPEPGTLALLGIGLAALGLRRRKSARR